jgi:hypothetical protein
MGIYNNIGIQLNSTISTFEDTISDPTQQAYKYRIVTADTCGNTTYYGDAHKTIHLLTSINPGSGNPQLSWNDYSGFSYSKYFIYRGNSFASLALYDSISASFTSYTDVNPIIGMVYYGISVNPPNPCSPSKNLTACFSNLSQVNYNSISNYDNELNSFSVWPNPTNDFLNFELKNNNVKEFNLELMDVTGRLLFSKSYIGVYKEKIDVGEFSNGVYILKISNNSGNAYKNLIINR